MADGLLVMSCGAQEVEPQGLGLVGRGGCQIHRRDAHAANAGGRVWLLALEGELPSRVSFQGLPAHFLPSVCCHLPKLVGPHVQVYAEPLSMACGLSSSLHLRCNEIDGQKTHLQSQHPGPAWLPTGVTLSGSRHASHNLRIELSLDPAMLPHGSCIQGNADPEPK